MRAVTERLERYQLRGNRLAMIGLAVLGAVALMAVFGPFIAPYDPLEQDLASRLLTPSWDHPMGTDDLGRDILSRILAGASVSLSIGITVVAITATFGTLLGFLAGYIGGAVDEAVMRVVDVVLAFPSIILALVIAGLLGPGFENVVIALALTQWPAYTRLVRGTTLSVREMEYVEAAKAIRAPRRHIIVRHVMPNAIHPVVVLVTLDIATTIIFASALSFLGVGIQPPQAEWGSMLKAGIPYLRSYPHVTFFPGLMIMLTVLAFNFVGDGLRDAIDPKREEMMVVRG